MSIWASRFGERGVNLAAENSFRLQVNNSSSKPFTLNLFNLGGGSASQTSITTGGISVIYNAFIAELTNGIVTTACTFEIAQGISVLVSVPLSLGQTIANIETLSNPITNLQGQTGNLFIQPTAGDLTGKYYDFVITTPNITKIAFQPNAVTPSNQTTSFVTNNPFVTIDSNPDINFIQNSEIGNSYKIMGIDVYSNKQNQLLQGMQYAYRDVNGNFYSFGTDPVIDPYQPNAASLQMIYVDEFQIHTNTQFRYTIDGNTSVYLTFTYVQFGIEDFKEFDKIFYQQVRDKYWMNKKLLKKSRVNALHIE